MASSELREAVADGPILFRGFENIYKHVLRADARAFAKKFRDPPEQRFLLFHGAGVEHSDLDVHDIGASGDAVGIAIAEVRCVRGLGCPLSAMSNCPIFDRVFGSVFGKGAATSGVLGHASAHRRYMCLVYTRDQFSLLAITSSKF